MCACRRGYVAVGVPPSCAIPMYLTLVWVCLPCAQARGNEPLGQVRDGAQAFGSGVVQGLLGVILDPIRGAQRDGVEGFFKGVGRGLVGALVKPTVGVRTPATQRSLACPSHRACCELTWCWLLTLVCLAGFRCWIWPHLRSTPWHRLTT